MKLNNHFTPTWEIIENFRHYLALKHKKPILEKELAKELELCNKTMAKYKNKNSDNILINLSIYCIKNNVDIKDFVKYSNSVTLQIK